MGLGNKGESLDSYLRRLRVEKLCARLEGIGLGEREVAYALRKSKADSFVGVTRYFLEGEVPKRDVRLYRSVEGAVRDHYERACELPVASMSMPYSGMLVMARLDAKVLGDVASFSEDTLLSTKQCGLATLSYIESGLARQGLWLRPYDRDLTGAARLQKKLMAPVSELQVPDVLKDRFREQGFRLVSDVMGDPGAVDGVLVEGERRVLDIAMARHGLDYLWSD